MLRLGLMQLMRKKLSIAHSSLIPVPHVCPCMKKDVGISGSCACNCDGCVVLCCVSLTGLFNNLLLTVTGEKGGMIVTLVVLFCFGLFSFFFFLVLVLSLSLSQLQYICARLPQKLCYLPEC